MSISLIGIGMGSVDNLTREAYNQICEAKVLIGASRMTDSFAEGKIVYHAYKAEEIKEIIEKEKDKSIAILMSGDVGFFSGARKILEVVAQEVTVIPGISSVVYFCAKLKCPWQNVKLLSLHGMENNLIGYVKRYPSVFTLLSGREQLVSLLSKLVEYQMGDIRVSIGQHLSYPQEKIITGNVEEILKNRIDDIENLSVALFENENPVDRSLGGIEDEEFIRGNVPMTKAEVRSLSITKLNLKRDSILWDVGAGTGSVSIEVAMKLIDGKVYAIERKKEAVELIQKNKIRFAADQVEIIEGLAPEALKDLPAPSHVFIGGSAGNMEQILDTVFDKNPDALIVINAIALDTVAVVMELIKKRKWSVDITQLTLAKNKNLAGYQMMTGMNPVYIFKVGKKDRQKSD